MKAEEKNLIKRKLRNTVNATLKQTGKRPTKEQIVNVLLDIVKSVNPEPPKNFQEKPEPESIAEILKNLRGLK